VHVSSNSPFGVNPTVTDVFRAEEPFNPYMGYGRSKMRAEMLVREAHDHGLQTTIVRPPWFYGPHQPARQTSFLRALRRGRFPLLGDGRNRRSMVYIDNLVDGLIRAELAQRAAGRAYWIADPRPYEMREILHTTRRALAAEGLALSGSVPRLPGVLADCAERADALLQQRGRYLQAPHVLGELNKTIACDISRAQAELGYAPRMELYEGMRRSVRWCLEQGIAL
jgi:nucleoside-diphosphate-sugar epimerase